MYSFLCSALAGVGNKDEPNEVYAASRSCFVLLERAPQQRRVALWYAKRGGSMMARAQLKLALRPYLPADALLLAEIFRASIEQLTGDDYSEAQQQAWASAADDEQAFAARLASELTLIATLDGSPVGFASLKGPDHIEMLYVHPAMASQGVGSMLVNALERLAAGRGARRLTVDASDGASGFFDKRGYIAQRRNTVTHGDEWIANTTMEKRLVGERSAS